MASEVFFRSLEEAYCNASPLMDTALMTSLISFRSSGEAYCKASGFWRIAADTNGGEDRMNGGMVDNDRPSCFKWRITGLSCP